MASSRRSLGARFRDSGFKNGLIDDLRVFDVALTAAEVARHAARRAPTMATAFDALPGARSTRHHRRARAELRRLRRAENALIAGVPEIMVMEELPRRGRRTPRRGAYDAPERGRPPRHAGRPAAFPADRRAIGSASRAG